jgi:hypothetical protein
MSVSIEVPLDSLDLSRFGINVAPSGSSETEDDSLCTLIFAVAVVIIVGFLMRSEGFSSINWSAWTDQLGYPRPQGNLPNARYGLIESAREIATKFQSQVFPSYQERKPPAAIAKREDFSDRPALKPLSGRRRLGDRRMPKSLEFMKNLGEKQGKLKK